MNYLKKLRMQNEMTQQEAADFLQVSRRSYQMYETTEIDNNKMLYLCEKMSEYGRVDEEHGMLSIEKIKKICTNVFKDYSVEFCYLFGSYAKGKANEKSDIDLFVSMPVNGIEYYDLLERLREELKKKVDLIHDTQIKDNYELTKEIMKYGIKIYG